MTITLYYSKITPTVSATQAATGYPASNLTNESIRRPWRSTSLTTPEVITFTCGDGFSPRAVTCLMLEDINFSSATVEAYYSGGWHSVGALQVCRDKPTGRYRGIATMTVTATQVRVSINSSTVYDGKSYFHAGAAYILGNSSVLPLDAWPGSTVGAIYPTVTERGLPNGRIARAWVGDPYLVVNLRFVRNYDQDGLELIRETRFATAVVDLQIGDYPRLPLPVRALDSQQEQYADGARAEYTVKLTEVVVG